MKEKEKRGVERRTKMKNITFQEEATTLSGKLTGYMEQLWKIHRKFIKPFEQTYDTYWKQLNTIYKEETKNKDKWKNFLNDFRKISLSYLKTLAEAFITTVVCVVLAVQAPFVLAGYWLP